MERVPIQEVYAELEPFLEHDAHYWLQRGSYELERGDLTKAEVFLAQAKAKSHPNDYMVNTEWAYLMLQRACDDPTDSRALEWFRDGFEILLDLVGTSGRRTVNTYVVLGQKTVEWCRVSGIDVEDSKRVLQTVRDAFVVGGAHHVANRQFAVAKDQVDRAYLELAVDPDL
jgi:hypothetical protein